MKTNNMEFRNQKISVLLHSQTFLIKLNRKICQIYKRFFFTCSLFNYKYFYINSIDWNLFSNKDSSKTRWICIIDQSITMSSDFTSITLTYYAFMDNNSLLLWWLGLLTWIILWMRITQSRFFTRTCVYITVYCFLLEFQGYLI